MKIRNKKILMIVPHEKFRDEELVIPQTEFKKEGALVAVASLKKENAIGMFGHKAPVDVLLEDLTPTSYHAVVFVGGQGTPDVRSHPNSVKLAIKAAQNPSKVVSAICWAPTILAKAGILRGKKATVWEGDDPEYGKKTKEILTDLGAHFSSEDVVIDGNIITANGAHASKSFALAIIKKLSD